MEHTNLSFRALTPETWADFEELFGKNGACGGCWCMWWRLTRSQFAAQAGEGNRAAMHALVEAGNVPGILAYADGRPVGWCSIAPREEFSSLDRSRTLKRVDEMPVWSIVCFFVARGYRNRGVTRRLIRAAVEHARSHGAEVIEAYPLAPRAERVSNSSAFTGLASAFQKEGFAEIAHPSGSKIIMRYAIGQSYKDDPNCLEDKTEDGE